MNPANGSPGTQPRRNGACSEQPDNGLYAYVGLNTDSEGAAHPGSVVNIVSDLTLLGADSSS